MRPFVTDTQILRLKRANGTFGSDTLVVRRSVHGPLVSEKNGRALAVRIAGLDRMNGVEERRERF